MAFCQHLGNIFAKNWAVKRDDKQTVNVIA